MTAGPGSRLRERLADIASRIRERLDDIEAAPVVTAVGIFLLSFIGALIVGSDRAINLILAAAFVWLAWNWGLLHTRTDEALDAADENKGQIEDVKTVLFGNETGTGKHAKGNAA